MKAYLSSCVSIETPKVLKNLVSNNKKKLKIHTLMNDDSIHLILHVGDRTDKRCSLDLRSSF